MEKQSTAYRLSFYISTAIITVFLIFIFIIYQFSYGLMRENIENNAIGLSSKLISVIKADVVTSQEVAKNTALQIPYYAQNGGLEVFLRGIFQRYPFIQSINIDIQHQYSKDGNGKFSAFKKQDGVEFCQNNEKSLINISISKQIDSMINSGNPGWIEPYRSEYQNQIVALYYVPVEIKTLSSENINIGYVTIELSLSYIDSEIKKVRIGKSGFAFLVSSQGVYLTHPRKNWILTENIKDLSEEVYHGSKQIIIDALRNGTKGSFTAYPRILDFKKSWVYYTPISENGWKLLFVMPYSELYSDLYKMLIKIILVSFLGVVFLFFMVIYISKKITDPLAQIAAEIHNFSTAGRAKLSKNELENLEKSFTLMQAWYKKFKHEQEATQKRRKTNKK